MVGMPVRPRVKRLEMRPTNLKGCPPHVSSLKYSIEFFYGGAILWEGATAYLLRAISYGIEAVAGLDIALSTPFESTAVTA